MVKNPRADAGDSGSVPGLGRSPGEGSGNPLQDSCLGSPMDRGVWWATVQESDTTEQLNSKDWKRLWWTTCCLHSDCSGVLEVDEKLI